MTKVKHYVIIFNNKFIIGSVNNNMFSEFLFSHFIKNYKDVSNRDVRYSYGYFAGVMGIIINLVICIIELIIGFFSNSIAVTADGFHNLTDVASSIITILGFKLSRKPADANHPFGHGRIEYISAMFVSIIIIIIGYEFIKSSFDRILNPSQVKFNLIAFIIILVSIPLKFYLSSFHKNIGIKINSSTLKASSIDALNDVFILSAASLSLLLSNFTTVPVDGYIGIIVALFIIFSGYQIVRETISPLLGEAPDPAMVKELSEELVKYKYISGVHDIIIHNYGPGRGMASIHAEVPCDASILKIHEEIDKAERELSKKLGIFIIIHMDPINTNDKEVKITHDEILAIIKKFPEIESIHDFRVVGEGEKKNLVFDMVVKRDAVIKEEETEALTKTIDLEVRTLHPRYNTVITVDRDFL